MSQGDRVDLVLTAIELVRGLTLSPHANRLDHDLFDVTALIEAEYDDASRGSLPVLVDYGKGANAAQESKSSSLDGAERTVTLPRLGIAAFQADKTTGREFWADLTRGEEVSLDGVKAVVVTGTDGGVATQRAWIATDDPHHVLKITQEGGREPAALAFSEFDQEFVVEAPPAKDVLRS